MQKVIQHLKSFFFFSLTAASLSVLSAEVRESAPYKVKNVLVRAKDVAAVEVTFKKEFVRSDCNSYALIVEGEEPSRIVGDAESHFQEFFARFKVIGTEAYCPIPTPVKEVIESGSFTYPLVELPNRGRSIELKFILPTDIFVEVNEVEAL